MPNSDGRAPAAAGKRTVFQRFHDTFLRIIVEYPFLLWLGGIALIAELGYAILNIATLPLHLDVDLRAAWATGYVLATFLLVEAVFKSPFGAIGDRIGRKPLMVIGPFFSAGCCLSMYYLNQPWEFIVMHGLNGLGFAAFWPSCFTSISDRVRKRDIALAMSVFNLTYMMGVALGPLAKTAVGNQDLKVQLVPILVKERSPDYGPDHRRGVRRVVNQARMGLKQVKIRAQVVRELATMGAYDLGQLAARHNITNQHRFPFLLVAALFALTGTLALILAPAGRAPPLADDDEPEQSAAPDPVDPHSAPKVGIFEQVIVGIKTIPWLMAIAFCIFMGIGTLTPCLEPYALKVYHLQERQFGVLLLPCAAILGILALPLGRLSDRLGPVRVIRWGTMLCTLGMIALTFQPLLGHTGGVPGWVGSYLFMIPLISLVGVGFVAAMPAWLSTVTQMAPKALTGAVLGAAQMAQGIGALIGGILGGHLWAHFQDSNFPEAPVAACGIMLALGTLLTLWHVREPVQIDAPA